jgi:hypothetical protein
MTDWHLMLALSAVWLVAALVPAVFFRLQPRIEPALPLRGRWVGPFLWGSACLSFMLLITLVAAQGH